MNFLFIHNNFPAQFRHVAQALAEQPEHKVAAIGSTTAQQLRGTRLQRYVIADTEFPAVHPFARRFELDCRRAEQVLYAASALKQSGFDPHIVVAHTGWGEALPLREAFPRSRIIAYGELYYRSEGLDVGFDPDFPTPGRDGMIALQLKNMSTISSIIDADDAVTPTVWQKTSFPPELQRKMHVIHEGIRTDLAVPNPKASITLNDGTKLTCKDEVVTFVARNLEPLRGYHVFTRALPRILHERPNARILIVGGDGVSYGARPPAGVSWRDFYYKQVAPIVDRSRVHFLGALPYRKYLHVLQLSSVHVYYTYPFVLSWSMLEAMSAGCIIIGSDTGPVQEVIDGTNGIRLPFFDHEALANQIIKILAEPAAYQHLREAARRYVVANYSSEDMTQKWINLMMQ